MVSLATTIRCGFLQQVICPKNSGFHDETGDKPRDLLVVCPHVLRRSWDDQ